jgi:hypothetical protein
MKIGPIVQILQTYLPTLTDYFSDTLQIDSIVANGGVVTVTTKSTA